MMWSEKHRPVSVHGMVGNEEARAAVMEWFAKWRKGAKPLLLTGPPGVGKTTLAYIVAEKFEYDMLGLNASDVRSKSKINEILGPAMSNASVMGSPMIFVDEVDGIHGRGDYGGSAALTAILKIPTVPIVLAANDITSDKMKSICKASVIINFKKIPPRLLRMYLNNILKKENATLGPGSMIKAISRSRGDIRSMINLAQSMSTGFNPQLESSSGGISLDTAVNAFFKAETKQEAENILYMMDGDPRTKIGAFYSSIISSNLDVKSTARYLDVLSEADMLYGQMLGTQNWRLLRYFNAILLNLYTNDSRIKYSQYNIPWPLLNKIRWDGAKIKSLSLLMAKNLHTSAGKFATLSMPYMLYCMNNDKSFELDSGLEDFQDTIHKEAGRLMGR